MVLLFVAQASCSNKQPKHVGHGMKTFSVIKQVSQSGTHSLHPSIHTHKQTPTPFILPPSLILFGQPREHLESIQKQLPAILHPNTLLLTQVGFQYPRSLTKCLCHQEQPHPSRRPSASTPQRYNLPRDVKKTKSEKKHLLPPCGSEQNPLGPCNKQFNIIGYKTSTSMFRVPSCCPEVWSITHSKQSETLPSIIYSSRCVTSSHLLFKCCLLKHLLTSTLC